MASPNVKFRPFQHLTRAGQKQRINARLQFQEGSPLEPPSSFRALRAAEGSASPAILASEEPPEPGWGREVGLFETGAGAGEEQRCLAAVSVLPAEASVLRGFSGIPEPDLRRAAFLTNLRVDRACQQDPALLAALLYVALRRARAEGRRTVAAYVPDPSSPVARLLDLRALPRPGSARATLAAQRLDVAMHLAHDAATRGALPFDPSFLMDEVTEALERWVIGLWDASWFRAIYDGTLTREQYAYSLAQMHQYVRWTTRILARCVAFSHDRDLRNHFLDHLRGEINHEVIIERDLAHLGEDIEFTVRHMVPNLPTGLFMAVQESVIGFHHDPVLLMASPLAAEGVTAHLDDHFLESLIRAVRGWGVEQPEAATRFWSSHINVDGGESGHWQCTLDAVGQRLRTETELQRFLGTCRMSMHALTEMYNAYVDDLSLWSPHPPASRRGGG